MSMNVIVHYPETAEKQQELEKRVAKYHADQIAHYIEKLNCPVAQKLMLVDLIIAIAQDKAQ